MTTKPIIEVKDLKKSFGKLEVLGAFAFSGTKLTTVTLPASFSSLYYTYVWDVLDTKGRVKETRQREVQSYGDGAFANIPTLTAILVADGSEAFESRDGVLYGIFNSGTFRYGLLTVERHYWIEDADFDDGKCDYGDVYKTNIIIK